MKHMFDYNTAHLPPEFYGAAKDEVKLLTIDRSRGMVSGSPFIGLRDFLRPGDLLVFNDSLMIPSSLNVFFTESGRRGKLNFGTSSVHGMMLCEPRPRNIGELLSEREIALTVPESTGVKLVKRHSLFHRYWWAEPADYFEFTSVMSKFGQYIRYGHIPFDLPPETYDTVFSSPPGSVEFPSASRPFTQRVMQSLEKNGVRFATITLHCNLSSLESSEFENATRLLDEEYAVSRRTLEQIQKTHEEGGRVLAVGTTVARALESCAISGGKPIHGRTDIYITPGFRFGMIDGLITGLHEPDGSHVDMVSALVDDSTLLSAYSVAKEIGYSWHEFGDLSLIV